MTFPLHNEVSAWIADDPDPATAAELTALLTAANDGEDAAGAELTDRFLGLLQFGTAGLRGAIGGGPARMNRAVVARAAAGLGAFLAEQLGAGSREPALVVIGFDARHYSRQFAADSAEILAGSGARVMLFDQHCPTPVLAYAVRALGADAGVMVTASHNPPEDNGYKVYLGGRVVTGDGQGAQLVAPYDAAIAQKIAAVDTVAALPRSNAYETIGSKVIDEYVDSVLSLADSPHPHPGLRIVYTPMHGVGGELFTHVLQRAGFTSITRVNEQFAPDPDFPTVAFPNPEEAGALDLAFEVAEEVAADLIIANDPDADRVSIAIPSEGTWRQLTGDEIGALLGEMLAAEHDAPGASGAPQASGSPNPAGPAVFANSIVSSRLLGAIARSHGIDHHETLTGFKWISRAPGLTYGYEEAIGYCVNPAKVRDKDGISAGLKLAFLAARTAAAGRTLADLLDDLALTHGLYSAGALSVRMSDLADIPAAMARLRANPPTALAGAPVVSAVDLLHESTDSAGAAATAVESNAAPGHDAGSTAPGPGDDSTAPSPELPSTDALIYTTGENDRVIVRPSGTEPKVKCYLEVITPVATREELVAAKARAAQRLEELKVDIAAAAGFPTN